MTSNQSKKDAHFALLEKIAFHSRGRKIGRFTKSIFEIGLSKGNVNRLYTTELFDPKYYKERYKDISGSDEYAFTHFIKYGQFEGRNPTAYFDATFYIEQLKEKEPDTITRYISPYLHYLSKKNHFRSLKPSRGFDSAWYAAENADVVAAGLDPLVHFLRWGVDEGRLPMPGIDLRWWCEHLDAKARREMALVLATGGAITGVSRPREPDPVLAVAARIAELEMRDFLPSIQTEAIQFPLDRSITAISFDVWDTLLRRDCHPDEIKIQSARFLYLRHFSALRRQFRDIVALFRARIESERRVAKGDGWEFRLADAMRDWLLSVSSAPPRELEKAVAELVAYEIRAESRATRPDAPALAYLAEIEKRPFYISDFYGDRAFLETVLANNGIHSLQGFVSNEHFKTKREGDLFDHIIAEEGLDPSGWLHVGDNIKADIHSAQKKGIQTFHYVQPSEVARTEWHATGMYARLEGDCSVHARRILSILSEEFSGGDEASRLGARLAPIAVGYALFVIEEAIKNQHDEVFFFTREGQFFRDLCQLVKQEDPYGVNYPKLKLIEVSRRATFAASLQGLSPPALMRLWTMYKDQSVAGLAASLNLDADIVKPIAARLGLVWDKKIVGISQDPGVTKLLADREFKEHAENRLGEQRSLLTSYLEHEGFIQPDKSRRFIVDIGWRGTIQDNISLASGMPIDGCYIGLFGYLNPQVKHCSKSGWLFDDNKDDNPARLSDVAVLEMLFNGKGGSVEGYRYGDGQVRADRNIIEGEENVIRAFSMPFQQAILEVAPRLLAYIRLHGLTSADLKLLARLLVQDIMHSPPQLLADAYLQLSHNELFGTGEIDKLANLDGQLKTVLTRKGAPLHAGLQQVLGNARWPAALMSASVFRDWWQSAGSLQRLSVPTPIFRANAPFLAKHLGDRISIFSPPSLRGSGGHRTIYNVARAASALGFHIDCCVDGLGDGVHLIEDWLDGASVTIHTSWHHARPSSLALATIASSARWVAELPQARTKAYLVQDHEAYFNPASDNFLVAENSYALGLRHYTIGNWLTRVLSNNYRAEALPAGLGLDTRSYFRKPQITREKAVCFLYQPEKPRRLPKTAIAALQLVKQAVPDCSIYVYGSDTKVDFGFPAVQLGLINELETLNDLYNRCSAGLCISMTNPSRIPYEMMATGCIPVDIYRFNNLLDHQDGTIHLAYQSENSIAEALIRILTDDETTLSARRQHCIQKMAVRTLEWESGTIANMIAAQIACEPFEAVRPSCSYHAEPVFSEKDRMLGALAFCAHQKALALGGGDSG